MIALDLHGMQYEQARRKVEDFLMEAKLPVVIITGNSIEMKKIVKEITSKYNMGVFINPQNMGRMTILEKEL